MSKSDTQVAILGAGPGGATTSIFLSKSGIKHVILDKAVFPRDKICGDALSGKTVTILDKIEKDLPLKIQKNYNEYLDSWGVRFVAPNGKALDIPFSGNPEKEKHAPGFIVRRFDFDNFLFQMIDPKYATVMTGCEVKSVTDNGENIEISYAQNGDIKSFKSEMVIGAEGDRSLVAKKLAGHKMDPRYYIAGLRAYYKNVTKIHPQNFIELHFIKEVLPGYLWVFPMPNNYANVGIGILSEKIRSKKLRLKDLMLNAIKNNPNLKDRFSNAELVDGIKGWGLPLGSVRRNLSGNRFILVGDAASLIDPFTGEGIGNAMISGQYAAQIVMLATRENNYSNTFLKSYDELVYKRLWSELKLSYNLQKLVNNPWLFNFIANKAAGNKTLQETLSCMFSDLDMRAKLKSPLFYLKLIFNR